MRSRSSFVRRYGRAAAVFGFCTLLPLALTSAAKSARAGDLPRYKLKPGMELVYHSTNAPKESEDDKPTSYYTFEWTVDVVRPADNGGWRLLVREKMTSVYKNQGKETKRDRTSQCYVDVDAEGRMSENRSVKYSNPASELFPPLAHDEASLAAGWQSHVTLDDKTRSFTAPDKAPAEGTSTWRLVEIPHGALDPIYELSTVRDYTFDAARGLVTKFVSTYKQGWPASRKGETTVRSAELADTRELPADELAALAAESDRFFAACDAADELTDRASLDFAHTAELFDQAEAKLKELDGKLTVEALKGALEEKLASLVRSRSYEIESAEKFGKQIGQPSPDWETTDLEGSPRKLTDYRGKVVLLDFWYRGCGWCIRSMPQLKQLAADFDGQPFALLGMNNDRKLDDAHFVIDTMKLPYENLRNGPHDDNAINKKYEINGWPTLVILDGKGVIRHIHVGYSPTLREDLAAKIRELLAEK